MRLLSIVTLTVFGWVVIALGVPPRTSAVGPQAVAAGSTVDGLYAGGGLVTAETPLRVTVTGRGGVPLENVGAVALNVTVTDAWLPSFVTVWPSGEPQPLASNVNFFAGQTTANLTVAKVGADGAVMIATGTGAVSIVVDIAGWYPANGGYHALSPTRIVDTRASGSTVDDLYAGGGLVTAEAPLRVTVTGRGGVPLENVGAVALNVTVIDASLESFVTVWPSGEPQPLASNVNFFAGQTTANLTVAKVGTDGAVMIATGTGAVSIVVDIAGWHPANGGYHALSPARIADTRSAGSTVDGLYAGGGLVTAEAPLKVTVTGRGGVPLENVGAVALNVTVTDAWLPSFVTVWPSGEPQPLASNVNFFAGQTTANFKIAKLGADGAVMIATGTGAVSIVVDIAGWYQANGAYHALSPARIVDTRVDESLLPNYPEGRCDSLNPGLQGLGLPPGMVPDGVELIGTSLQGRPIWAEYWGPANPSRVALIIGQVHGNECAPSRMVKAVRARRFDRFGVWLIPTLNPDGYAMYSRRNAGGVDLNADGGFVSQPETRALMEFTGSIRPVLSVHVHSPNGFVGWFGRNGHVADNPSMSQAYLSSAMAQTVAAQTGLRHSGAGTRPFNSWFLWQGQRTVNPTGESLLVEISAVSDHEVPNASPRTPTQSIQTVDRQCHLVLDALERFMP